MTDRKDFKRIVRARSHRTGETYSSALRHVRNAPDRSAATASKGTDQREPFVNITRAIPEIRSTNVDKTTSFYTELLGFDARTEDGLIVSFVSASNSDVEIILNRDGFALPSGFTVEVETEADVAELFNRAPSADVRVIEPLDDARFSALDPSGRRVTITAADRPRPPRTTRDATRSITRAIPGSVLEPAAAKRFYGDYLGFRVKGQWSNPVAVMFESPTTAGVELLTGANLTSPDSFDLDVGTTERLDAIHAAAVGSAVVMGGPQDFADHGVRCFLLIDPNGVAINVVAPLPQRRT